MTKQVKAHYIGTIFVFIFIINITGVLRFLRENFKKQILFSMVILDRFYLNSKMTGLKQIKLSRCYIEVRFHLDIKHVKYNV